MRQIKRRRIGQISVHHQHINNHISNPSYHLNRPKKTPVTTSFSPPNSNPIQERQFVWVGVPLRLITTSLNFLFFFPSTCKENRYTLIMKTPRKKKANSRKNNEQTRREVKEERYCPANCTMLLTNSQPFGKRRKRRLMMV